MPTPPELVVSLRGRRNASLALVAAGYATVTVASVKLGGVPTFLVLLPLHLKAIRRSRDTLVTQLELTERQLVLTTPSRKVRLPLAAVVTNYPGGRGIRIWRKGAAREKFRVADTRRTRALLDLLPR